MHTHKDIFTHKQKQEGILKNNKKNLYACV